MFLKDNPDESDYVKILNSIQQQGAITYAIWKANANGEKIIFLLKSTNELIERWIKDMNKQYIAEEIWMTNSTYKNMFNFSSNQKDEN